MITAQRTDLPTNRKLAMDILKLEKDFEPRRKSGADRRSGADQNPEEHQLFWDRDGRWVQINRWWLRSRRFEFNINPIYVLAFVPPGYGERRGDGAGIEEFYVPNQLRIRRRGEAWRLIPNTYAQYDRRGGSVVNLQHLYACVHIRGFDPRKHDITTSLKALQLLLTDPEAFA